MICPYCGSSQVFVINSRSTKEEMQIWRRRECIKCGNRYTTHETIDLSHLVVIKKSGRKERFSRVKLYSGILWATIGVNLPHREQTVNKITEGIEREILSLKRKVLTSQEIGDIVLKHLSLTAPAVFLRFLTYYKDLKNQKEIKRELGKYLSGERRVLSSLSSRQKAKTRINLSREDF